MGSGDPWVTVMGPGDPLIQSRIAIKHRQENRPIFPIRLDPGDPWDSPWVPETQVR
jgi:hypothetical protein